MVGILNHNNLELFLLLDNNDALIELYFGLNEDFISLFS